MKAIWKFVPSVEYGNIVAKMPKGAEIIHVGITHPHTDPPVNAITVWAIVETTAPVVKREFNIVGTGWELGGELTIGKHVGSVQVLEDGNWYVWHVFDLGEQ